MCLYCSFCFCYTGIFSMTNHENSSPEPSPVDETIPAIHEVIRTLGVEPGATPGPRQWASDIRSGLTPDPATEADIAWVHELMRDEPLVAMTTAGSKATIPMYSVFTTKPDGRLRFLFRSFKNTEHASVIDEATARGVGRAAVQLLLYRSGDLSHVGLELFGLASRVPEEDVAFYEDVYAEARGGRGHRQGEHWGRPELALYVVEDWTTLQIQSRLRNNVGDHVSNGKAPVTEEQLSRFERPSEAGQ
jgi:hypothetical protein